MNIKKIINNSIIIFILSTLIMSACTKPNEDPPAPSTKDRIDGRKIRYTVMVVDPSSSGLESALGVDSAVVSLVMNDSIYDTKTDKNGIAKFNNLAAGIVAVKITHPKYSTISMIVDITAKNDENEYDAKNLRNASTLVAVFPTEGDNMTTLSGKALADLDLTKPGLENPPAGLQISAHIAQKQLINYVNHSGDGKILSIMCQAKINKTKTDLNGDFSLKAPASHDGLKVVIVSDDFAQDQITASGKERHVYKAVYDTVTVFAGMHHVSDILFK